MIHQETEHVVKALARLVEQFKNATRVRELLTALVQPVQEIDDSLWQLVTERDIDSADGVNLDALGAIVGQEREGRDDDTYRLWIRARSLANRSNGHPDDALKILELIAPGTEYDLEETFPAAYLVTVFDLLIPVEQIYQLLALAKPAGVRLNVVYSPDLDETFTLAPGGTLVPGDFDLGFGDSSDPGMGGQLAGIV